MFATTYHPGAGLGGDGSYVLMVGHALARSLVRQFASLQVEEVDHYYRFTLTGESQGGGIASYEYDIYEDPTGTNVLYWKSAADPAQAIKEIQFHKNSTYRVIGYVHGQGATTQDSHDIVVVDAGGKGVAGFPIIGSIIIRSTK